MMRKTAFRASITIALSLSILAAWGCSDKSLKYYNLGVSASEREEYDRAAEYWRESLKYRSSDPDTRYNLGLALLALEKYEDAEFEFREALKYAPYDHEIHYGLGKALEMQNDLLEAKNSYERSINLKPNFVPSLIGIASINMKMGRYPSAENYATVAVQIEPTSLEGNLLLSEIYFRIGNYQEALAQLQSIRKFAPQHPELYLTLGKVTYARHQYRDAIEALMQARSLGMSNADIYLYLGLTHLSLENFADAETYFKLSLFKEEGEKRAWQGLGTAYAKTKKWDKALDAFSRALALDPRDQESTLGISYVMLNQGRFEDAIARLTELTSRSEPPPMSYYYLGHCNMRLEKYEEAARAFKSFMDVWKGDARLREEVASIIDALGS